jgi:hypothetical protein
MIEPDDVPSPWSRNLRLALDPARARGDTPHQLVMRATAPRRFCSYIAASARDIRLSTSRASCGNRLEPTLIVVTTM